MNARHTNFGYRATNRYGTALMDWDDSNAMKYKTKIYTPVDPTYILAQTFLNLCIADSRLILNNLNNGKLETEIFDSDHKAIIINLELQQSIYWTCKTATPVCDYTATNWKAFAKHITKSLPSRTVADENISIEEIDSSLELLTSKIKNRITEVVPKIQRKDIKKITSKKITRWHKEKSRLSLNTTNNVGLTLQELYHTHSHSRTR